MFAAWHGYIIQIGKLKFEAFPLRRFFKTKPKDKFSCFLTIVYFIFMLVLIFCTFYF